MTFLTLTTPLDVWVWIKRGRGLHRKSHLRIPTLQLQLELRTQAVIRSTLPGFSSNFCSSCALHLSSPRGAVINVSVLGVGVIYSTLHVQHRAPQAGKINNRKLQQAASEESSLEIRVPAPSRLTIDFIWSIYTSHHAINPQGRFADACSPTKGPTVSGLPPTTCADLQLLLHWFPYLSQAAALLCKSCHSAAYSKEQSDGGSTPCVMWPINAPHLWFLCTSQWCLCTLSAGE